MSGTLTDTYVAAITHGLVTLPPETTLVGVVRKPTPWLHGAVDENVSELGPPVALLERFKRANDAFAMDGICDEEAHAVAWDDVEFERRYRRYLADSAVASDAIDTFVERLERGESLALVCYENTDKKRCHRTILGAEIERRR